MTDIQEHFVLKTGWVVAREIDRILLRFGFEPEADKDWLSDNLLAIQLPNGELELYVGGLLILQVVKLESPRFGWKIESYF